MQSESEETSQTSQKSQEQLLEEQIQEYISTLSDREKIVFEIAKEHLQSSFSMERSIGFITWLKEKHN